MAAMMDPSQIAQLANNLTFEINPNHDLMVELNKLRRSDVSLARDILNQNLDNCLLSSGLLFEFNEYIERINSLMLRTLTQSKTNPDEMEINTDNMVSTGAHREEQTTVDTSNTSSTVRIWSKRS